MYRKCIILFLLFLIILYIDGERSYRVERFFPFYSVVRFENSICIGTCKLTGTCYTRKECKTYGGRPSGTCAKRLGVCCIVQKTCGGTSHLNNTYFQNPGYPSPQDGTSRCSFSINRCDANICQLRLDFLSLDLAQPNGDGQCVFDSFTVTGGASRAPTICGDNTGQHMYIDFDGDTPINLAVKTTSQVTKSRSWNIKMTQIACDCPTKAPSGCLQYFTEPSGSVQSFNFASTANTNPTAITAVTGTREMANLQYGICIAMTPNFCGIQWSQNGAFSFTVSGNSEDPTVGTPTAELEGAMCMNDFVIIPNPVNSTSLISLMSDRFCGNGFTTKTSYTKPFTLYVVTDANESNGDIANRGFDLNYRQVACMD